MIKRKTTEEYVEIIFVLQNRNGYAKTGKISSEMGIQPPSVTEMLQKLEEQGYIQYKPYKGAILTDAGKKLAHELMKKHKIIADFLEIIGVERELAEADACQIEHHVTVKTLQRLGKFVEFINDAPHEPKWIEHFNYYVQTGKRKQCSFYNGKESYQS
jgi:DtxR family transcriptional regulator, Mn-dependent transcriptional regulator